MPSLFPKIFLHLWVFKVLFFFQIMSDGKEVANQSAMQVQNLKQNLNEWKYVITAADAVLNTADPMKSAAAHAGLYTSVYVLFLITNVSSTRPLTEFHPIRFHPKFTPIFSQAFLQWFPFSLHSLSQQILSSENSMTR